MRRKMSRVAYLKKYEPQVAALDRDDHQRNADLIRKMDKRKNVPDGFVRHREFETAHSKRKVEKVKAFCRRAAAFGYTEEKQQKATLLSMEKWWKQQEAAAEKKPVRLNVDVDRYGSAS